jgi:hypothetical protein
MRRQAGFRKPNAKFRPMREMIFAAIVPMLDN